MSLDTISTLWRDPPEELIRPDNFAVQMQADAATPQEFIAAIKDAALATDSKTGVPAGFTVAQAALESGWGRYVPKGSGTTGRNSYNLFGIKALAGQDYVTCWTWEYDSSGWHRVQAKFRAYGSYQESIDDHARLLTGPTRYAQCLSRATDVAAYARCVHASGYATDPAYADKLVQIMRTWGLLELRAPRVPTPPACRVVVQVGTRTVEQLPGEVRDGATWCPTRALAEALGATVTWEPGTRTVRVRA